MRSLGFLFGLLLLVAFEIRADLSGVKDWNPRNKKIIETRHQPADRECDDWTFSFVGDNHSTQIFNRSDKIFSRGLEMMAGDRFIVHGGDFTTQGRPDGYVNFFDMISKTKVPIVIGAGNHDILYQGNILWKEHIGDKDFEFSYCGYRFVVIGGYLKGHGYSNETIRFLDNIKGKADFLIHHISAKPPAFYGFFHDGYEAMIKRLGFKYILNAHIHYFNDELKIGDTKLIISGGGGGFLLKPWQSHHFVRFRIKKDGTITYEKVNIPLGSPHEFSIWSQPFQSDL